MKLYKPQCLEILESMQIICAGNDDDDGDRAIIMEKVFMLKYIYYTLNIGRTDTSMTVYPYLTPYL